MPPKIAEKPAAETKAGAPHQRELEAAISSITKSYGEGSIMRLGDARALVKIDVIPTGALALDLAWASAASRAAASWKFSGRNRPAKPRSCCTSSPTRKKRRTRGVH